MGWSSLEGLLPVVFFGVFFKGGTVRKKSRVSTANLLLDWLGGGFKHVLFSPLKIGEDEPTLTIIFSRWVG